jgi:outer membrane protein insertion porin family
MAIDRRASKKGMRRYGRVSVILIFITSLFFFPSVGYASEPADVIMSIEVEGLTRINKEEFIDLVSFHVGERLNRDRLSHGIRRAFSTGIFLDIKAVSERHGGGIRLTYRVREIPIVEGISVRGNRAVRDRDIRKAFVFREGEGFIDDLLDSAGEDLVSLYHGRGFPRAKIDFVVSDDRRAGNVDILIEVEEGEPQLISKIHLPDHLRSYLRMSEGDILDMRKLEKGMMRIRKHLKKQKHVQPVVGPYSYTDGELSIPVEPGPKLMITFQHNRSVRTKALRKKLTFFEDEEVNDELIEASLERITAFYHSQGFLDAEVAAAVSREKEVIRVDYYVFEGDKVFVRRIRFSGSSLLPRVLQSIVHVKEKKPYDSERLKSSREAITRFYNALGFLNASVSDIREEYDADGKGVDIEFVIDEGTQVLIGEIDISGNSVIGTDVIRNVLRFHEGDPYNAIDVGDSRYRVQALYSRFGYLDAVVEMKSLIDDDEASIKLVIRENRLSVAGKIIIRGNVKTKSKIIKREFTIEEGDPYNLEEITRTKQKLYRLGLFSEVSIEILEHAGYHDPSAVNKKGHVRDVLVKLKESRPGAVELGIGYSDYEKLRGSIDISYRNIGGYHRQVGLRAEKNAVSERYVLYYREPWLFDRPNLPFNAYLTKEQKEVINIDTKDLLYKIDKTSFVAGVEMNLARNVKAGLNYEYSINDTSEVDPDVILSRDDTGTLGIGSVSPSVFYDTRDDPFEPSSGSLNGIAMKFASRLYFSETEFIKGTFQSSWYFLLRKGIVLAASLKGGAGHAFGATEELPLIERFFLGGRTTVRGYGNDLLGPKGEDGDPTGGNVFALINSELRFSLRKGFGIVTFIDGGNVWQLVHDIEPELKFTAGAGLRYRTPVGPLRIDYGHKLNRAKDESAGELHFSFGHAF